MGKRTGTENRGAGGNVVFVEPERELVRQRQGRDRPHLG